MPQIAAVALDTSFLISFLDTSRPNHAVAEDYFRHFVKHKIPMCVSVIVAGEFEVGQPFADLPIAHFRTQAFQLNHALCAAGLRNALAEGNTFPNGDSDTQKAENKVIINDLFILAWAQEERIPILLTEDEKLVKQCERLRTVGKTTIQGVLLKSGFNPLFLENSSEELLPLIF